MKIRLQTKDIILIVLVILAFSSAGWSWFNPREKVRIEYREAKTPRKVAKIPTATIECTKIKIIEKERVVKAVEIPDMIAADPAKEITAVGRVEPHDGETEVVAVFDKETFDTMIIERQLPRSFFEFKNDKEIGLRYGFNGLGPGFDIYGRWTFLRVMSAHMGAYVEGNSQGYGKAMLEISYRF